MAALLHETDTFRAHFEALERAEARREGSWLAPLRRLAFARFAELGFPTTRDEEWKYTNVGPIARGAFLRAPELRERTGAGWPDTLPLGEITPCRLVWVNGEFAPSLSRVEGLRPGVRVGRLADALATDREAIEAHLGRYAHIENRAFSALNTALWSDGAFVVIPRGVVQETPLHLLFLGTSEEEAVAVHPRTLILAEPSSEATIIETFAGVDGQRYLTNAVTEIVVAENAALDHYRVQQESRSAYHISTLQVRQERDSRFSSHAITLGGGLVRNDIGAVLDGTGIETTLNGLYHAGGRQHIDNHTVIDHAKPHCDSHELYKGMLDDAATGVFNGKIFVREDAQKTDAKQTNQNLLLSDEATINTKPQLEIFADDVRCTHGATIGQLDDAALFYLRSRGIGKDEARNLLTYAFAGEVLERLKVEPLRKELERQLLLRLPGVLPGIE